MYVSRFISICLNCCKIHVYLHVLNYVAPSSCSLSLIFCIIFCVFFFLTGLIHANHGGKIIDYLIQQLKSATTDVRG